MMRPSQFRDFKEAFAQSEEHSSFVKRLDALIEHSD